MNGALRQAQGERIGCSSDLFADPEQLSDYFYAMRLRTAPSALWDPL